MDNPQLRLNKFLAERLGVSRREADDLIAAGRVEIDGRTAILGDRIPVSIDKKPKVCYNGKIIPFETDFLYIVLNKPVGYVCSRRAQGTAPTLYDLLPKDFKKLKTVGRLDKDSSGLILLTNDGDFAYKMTHPKFRKTKVYEVSLDRPLEPLHQQMISDFGVEIGDGVSRFKIIKQETMTLSKECAGWQAEHQRQNPCGDRGSGRAPRKTSWPPVYMVFLTEGRNRQIRRTFAALGYEVVRLHRISFGKYELGDLKPGKYVKIEP